jgi:hypothetical protein
LQRRLRWFDAGAAALSSISPGLDGVYACPICLDPFERGAVARRLLTDEHVPPKAIKGKASVLTCATCNGRSSKHDAHLERAQRALTWGTPESTGPLPAMFVLNGVPNRGELSFDGETVQHSGVIKQNHPDDIARVLEALPLVSDGSEFQIRVSLPVDFAAAALSLLRAAYLAAFITFGYRYVLQPPLGRVRRAFLEDDRSVIPVVRLNHGTIGQRSIIPMIVEPHDLAGAVAVVIDRTVTFLPGIGAEADVFDSYAGRLLASNVKGEIRGHQWLDSWPRQAKYYLDSR